MAEPKSSTPIPVIGQAIDQFGRLMSNNIGRIRQDESAKWDPTKVASESGRAFNVVNDFRWTLSKNKNRKDVPYIWLREFNSNESVIKKQFNYYTQLLPEKAEALVGQAGADDPLKIYNEIFPHSDIDFCNQYVLPYFSKTNSEISTPNWTQIEPAGDIVASGASKLAGMIGGEKWGEGVKAVLEGLNSAANIGIAAQYPIVGALDRPRIFGQHNERTISVSFPLFNTVGPEDWKSNIDFIHTLMNQNTMYKTSFVTGVPPVFYDILIPGQYYCWASCVTNLNISNLGNTRVIDNYIVPDAYQVDMTLTEMVLPSKNQFNARFSGGGAAGKVNTSTSSSAKTEPKQSSQTGVTWSATSKEPPKNRGEAAARNAATIRDTSKPPTATWSATSKAPPRNRAEAAARNAANRQ